MKTFRIYSVNILAGAFLALGAAGSFCLAGEVRISIPPETVTLRPGPGMELASVNCLICHSPDYLAMQPPMPKKFWEAEVKKMHDKYGAPVPEDAIAKLADYLALAYGVQESPAKADK